MRTFMIVAMLFAAAGGCEGEDWPRFRHTNYIAFEADPAQTVTIHLTSIPIGKYTDPLRYRILNAKSDVVEEGEIEIGAKKDLAYAPKTAGLQVLEVNSGWNSVLVDVSVPHAIVSHSGVVLKTVRALDKLHFYVPTGAKQFTVFLQASVTGEGLTYRICGPDGKVAGEGAGDYDKYEKIAIAVPAGADGKAWSLSILPPNKPGMGLDDTEIYLGPELAPYRAGKAEWAVKFGKREHP